MDELIAPPPATETEALAWSWIRRWRVGFLAGGLSCVGLSLALTAALVATKPAFLTSVIQVWEPLSGPLSGGGASTEKIYKVQVHKPDELFVSDDLPITVSLSDIAVGYTNDPNARVLITLDTQSVKVVPADGISLGFKDGLSATFVVTAASAGNKFIRVVDQLWLTDAPGIREHPFPASGPNELRPRRPDAEDARLISLMVRDRPVFMIFDRPTMTDLQMVTTIVGLPGLLVFGLSLWRDRQKEKRDKRREDAARRVKTPDDYRKPRRI